MRGWGGDYCILEIVTTGPDPETAMPVEAAAIRVKEGAEADSICLLIDPGVPVPACLRERSGREEGEYLAGMEPRAALARVRAFLAHRHVLAHEGTGMEAALLERFGALPAGAVLDTQELAWLVSPYLRDHSLAALASSLLGEAPSWKALEDARLLLRILARLREAWGEAPRRVREAVAAALEEADSPWREFLLSRRGRRYPDLTEDIAGAGEAPWPRGRRGVREGRAGGEEAATLPDPVSVLTPGGALSSLLPDYEPRPQQEAMAGAVDAAMRDGAFLVVEAGTGVGKSLAYLVPGLMHARARAGPLVVSTYTRNLQEQLFHRDLPTLSRALGAVEFSLLKGRGNYLCLRKWAEWCADLARDEPVLRIGEITPAEAYAFLASWLTHTASGDLEEISLGLRLRLDRLVEELASSPHDCLRSRCPYSNRCWVERARARAGASEVVVVNHALLLSQMCAPETGPANLVLPDYGILVVDEAHHLEDVATEALGLGFSLPDCLRTLEEVSGRRGLLPRWGRLPLDREGQGLLAEAYELADRSRSQAEELCLRVIAAVLSAGASGEGSEAARVRLDARLLRHPGWKEAREIGADLAASLARIAAILPALAEKAHALEDGGTEGGMRSLSRAEALSACAGEGAAALEVFLREPAHPDFRRHLRWVERGSARDPASSAFALKSAPVSVGEELASLLFARLDCCVLTSASLRVPGGREGFSFFLRRTGLELAERQGKEIRLLALDSPFDYSCQVRLFAVTDLPEPRAEGEGFIRYMRGISRVVEEALLASGGKALVLLTSHQQVEFLYSELRPRLERHGLYCLRQRRGMPNALLLERFRADRDSVLLATEAFWEGVDVPGDSLSAVIMVKLPFRHPEDPVVAGRVEHHDLEGSGGWGSYYMPLAVTLFRQGVGRLIRRSTDQGIIVVLDPRFLTRSYARFFHASLPPGLRVERVERAELGDAVRRCFSPT